MAMTQAEFEVALEQLNDARGQVASQSGQIEDLMNQIYSEFQAVQTVWSSPAAQTFTDVTTWFNTVAGDLHAVLDDIVSRMDSAYQSYLAAEQANYGNMT